MKYVSFDIETTTIKPMCPENILQFSMVVEDTANILPLEDLPHFTFFVKQDVITGNAYALGMNGWILDYISGRKKNPPYPVYKNNTWIPDLLMFLQIHFGKSKAILAGKNVGSFDYQFLPEVIQDRFIARMLDPGSTFIDWNQRFPPDLATIKKKLGIGGIVSHDARDDAIDVIKIFRTQYVPEVK